MGLGSEGDLYNLVFQEESQAAKAKNILQKLKIGCVPDDEFVKDFTEGETNITIYKMKRHECHALLHSLQQMGVIKKKDELWCLDDKFLKVLERALTQIAELHNLKVKIEYSEIFKG